MAELKQRSYHKMTTQSDQIRYEFTNQDTIVLRKNGMYHKAMGSSAVILKSMGVQTRIRAYFDNMVKQEVLELATHVGRIDALKEMLKEKCGEVLRDSGGIFVIRLKKPMDSKELKRLKNNAQLKGEVTEGILTKNRSETPLAKEVRDIFGETVFLVRQMPAVEGPVLGRMLLEAVLRLHQTVRELMRDEKSVERRLAVDDAVDDLQGLLLHVPNFAQHADRLARIGRSLNRIMSRGGAGVVSRGA